MNLNISFVQFLLIQSSFTCKTYCLKEIRLMSIKNHKSNSDNIDIVWSFIFTDNSMYFSFID